MYLPESHVIPPVPLSLVRPAVQTGRFSGSCFYVLRTMLRNSRYN